MTRYRRWPNFWVWQYWYIRLRRSVRRSETLTELRRMEEMGFL